MNRTTLYTLLVICLAAIVFGAWLLRDHPPTPERLAWQNWHDQFQGQPGEAHVWLLGLGAPAGEDPLQAGEQWLEAARQDLAEADSPASTVLQSVPAPWGGQALTLPDQRILEDLLACRDREQPPCDQIETTLLEHAELLERFRSWPVLTESMRVAAPDSRIIPAMTVLVHAVQLDRLEQLHHLLLGQNAQARALVEQADRQFRAKLAQSPNLLQLMVAIRLLADQTDWLLVLDRDGLLELNPDDPMLAALDGVDPALESSFRGEYGLTYRLSELLEEEPELLKTESSWHQWLGYRWLYKPGMSQNQVADLYHWASALDEPGDLSALGRGNEPMWQARFQLQNLSGHFLWNMLPEAEPLMDYVGRVHDLSAKLALARAWLAEPELDDAALRRMVSSNPYRRGYGIELDEQRRRLCFDGPFEDRQLFRCIAVVQ